MRPETLTGYGFQSFAEPFTKDFKNGLCLVNGVNQFDEAADSNGAGKTTLFEAVCWCMYGVTSKGVTGDKVISWSKKQCMVQLTIQSGDDYYAIRRTRKHHTLKNSLKFEKNGADLTRGSMKETQKVINQEIGRSHEIFVAANYIDQENIINLPAMSDSQLKGVVETAVGTAGLSNSLKQVRQDIKRVNEELTVLGVDFKTDLHELEKDLVKYKTLVASSFDSSERLAAEIAKPMSYLEDGVPTSEDINLKFEQVEDLKSKIEGVKTLLVEIETAKAASVASKGKLDAATTKLGLCTSESYKLEKNSLKVNETNRCFTCGQALQDGEVGKQVLEDLAKANEELDRQVDIVKDLNMAAQADAVTLQELEQDLEESGYTEMAKQLSDLGQEHKDLIERKASEEVRQRVFEERLEANTILHSEELRKYETAKQDAFRTNQMINTKTMEYVLREKELNAKSAKLLKVEQCFAPDGVRAFLIDKITPILNQKTADYLGTLCGDQITADWNTLSINADGSVVENFNITVNDEKNGYVSLSAGERRKVRLACVMALQDIIDMRASKPFELFMVDEVDASLDRSGLERLMNLLKDRSKNTPVFVISHNNLKSWVTDTMTIIKDGGGSRIE